MAEKRSTDKDESSSKRQRTIEVNPGIPHPIMALDIVFTRLLEACQWYDASMILCCSPLLEPWSKGNELWDRFWKQNYYKYPMLNQLIPWPNQDPPTCLDLFPTHVEPCRWKHFFRLEQILELNGLKLDYVEDQRHPAGSTFCKGCVRKLHYKKRLEKKTFMKFQFRVQAKQVRLKWRDRGYIVRISMLRLHEYGWVVQKIQHGPPGFGLTHLLEGEMKTWVDAQLKWHQLPTGAVCMLI